MSDFSTIDIEEGHLPIKNSGPIFKDAAFTLDSSLNENLRKSLTKLIEDHGGSITPDSKNILAATYYADKVTYSPTFIFNSIKEGVQLLMLNYKIPNPHINGPPQPSRNSFSLEEDQFILEMIRKNPNKRNGRKLFPIIATKLGSHTGESIRYHYRFHLSQRLQYVYQIDESTEELLKDANGDYIKDYNLNNVKSNKNRFVARDDYELCKRILDLADAKDNMLALNKMSIPLSVFSSMAEQFPTHTSSAWRDRYRKFLKPNDLVKYVDYYEECLSKGVEPECLKSTPESRGKLRRKILMKAIEKVEPLMLEIPPTGGGDLVDEETPIDPIIELNQERQQLEPIEQHNKEQNEQQGHNEDLSKFFKPFFFQISDLTVRIKQIAQDNYSNQLGVDKLLEALESSIGIRQKFGHSMLYACSADVALFPIFIDEVLKQKVRIPRNVPGIWDDLDDDLLSKGDDMVRQALIDKHGKTRVNMRKEFLEE